MRSRYLLCYDITNDERLRRVARIAEAFGNRLQYSVFVCDLSGAEAVRLEYSLREVMKYEQDRIMLVDLGPAGPSSERRFRWLSAPWGELDTPGEARVV